MVPRALGIPTTRSLAVVTTGELVTRERDLPGAILTRVASSHLRVGIFQYAAQWGTIEDLRTLADYTLERHFPDLTTDDNPYFSLLQEVVKKQAFLVAQWQIVGFIHGVMNTDNMSIIGETIDYGPCAFMDEYDPATVFSFIDIHGRYAYKNQPAIAEWNLARFAETLLPLLHDNQKQAIEMAQDAISEFPDLFDHNWFFGMKAKLGMVNHEDEDQYLVEELLRIMHKHCADYTNTFRALTINRPEELDLFCVEEFTAWCKLWRDRLNRQSENKISPVQLMSNNNPQVIPRNYLVEEALEAAVDRGDYSVMEKLLAALLKPYVRTAEQDKFTLLPPPSVTPYRTYCGT